MSYLKTLTATVAVSLAAPCVACDLLGGDDDAPKESKKSEDEDEDKGKDDKGKDDDGKTLTDAKKKPDGPPPATTPAVDPTQTATPEVKEPSASARTEDEDNSINVFEAAAPATVFVTQTAIIEDYSMRAHEVPAGTGSGFIWDDQGHIVTNCHVALENCAAGVKAPKLSVTLFDHSVHEAEVVGHDPSKDIAVLKIAPPGPLVPMRRPDKDYKLVVGQKAIAIGNPFGLDHTLTVGVVSALGREVKGIGNVTIKDMVQTDAAINPGNSGGPLMDSKAQLLGMNTMIFSHSGSSAGIGFAVPYTSIQRVVPQIIEHGKPKRVGLGIGIFEDDSMGVRFGVEGVAVKVVPSDTPAFKGGLRPPVQGGADIQLDFIVAVDEARIKSFDDLYGALDGKAAGDKIKLQVMRLPDKSVFDMEIELIDL